MIYISTVLQLPTNLHISMYVPKTPEMGVGSTVWTYELSCPPVKYLHTKKYSCHREPPQNPRNRWTSTIAINVYNSLGLLWPENVDSHLFDLGLIDDWIASRLTDVLALHHPFVKKQVSFTVKNFLQRGFSDMSIACVKPGWFRHASRMLLPTPNLASSHVGDIVTSCHASHVFNNAN
jgi:hypothetical protein